MKKGKNTLFSPKIYLSIGLVVVSLVGMLGILHTYMKRTVTIQLQSDGFHPREITIPTGSSITFQTTMDRPFWPASNFHPSHRLYPEFDAKEPIAATSSWTHTFTVPGVWRYHNHLNSQHTGTIVVKDPPFISTDNPCDNSSIVDESIELKERCWIQDIESILTTKGIDAAFEVFGSLYEHEPAFASDCHDVTHLLGEAAYRAYTKHKTLVTTAKTTYCGYGFYHGFIEAALFTTGNFEEAKRYCADVQKAMTKAGAIASPNTIYACYHGLGHGTFDTQGYEKWGNDAQMVEVAISTCERVTKGQEEELVKQCVTGVFNGLANAYGVNRYALQYTKEDPVGVCRRQGNPRYKKACFMEVGSSYVRKMMPDLPSAMQWIENVHDPIGEDAIMIGYISDEARLSIDTASLNSFATICNNRSSEHLQHACVEGVVTGLFLWGKPGSEHVKALEFCDDSGLAANHKHVCFAYVLPRLRTVYSEERVVQICKTIRPEYQSYCGL